MLIRGFTDSGKKFRPSDWADRLYGAVFSVARRESEKSDEIGECVWMCNQNGSKCIIIDNRLATIEPPLYRFICNFANDNELVQEPLEHDHWDKDQHRVVTKPTRMFF